MGWIESLQKAIDYMEDHLLENVSIESIAKQANFSSFHFQRTFSILTDISVGEYMRRRRLTLAAQELSRTDGKIIDLALKYGYETPEAFAKAFRRQHGITPSEARKNLGKLMAYNRLVIQVILKGAEPMQYRMTEMDAFQIVGIKQSLSCVNDEQTKEIPKMWDQVNENGTCNRLFTLNNGKIKGVLGVCVDKKEDGTSQTIDYWIATDHSGPVPSGMLALEIPKSKWAVFEVHGPMPDAMPKVWKQIYSEWLPTSSCEIADLPELEVYSDEDPASPDLYSEIWIPIK